MAYCSVFLAMASFREKVFIFLYFSLSSGSDSVLTSESEIRMVHRDIKSYSVCHKGLLECIIQGKALSHDLNRQKSGPK